MLKIENTEVFGWETAIRGMRNPMNSWDKSDSGIAVVDQINTGLEPIFTYDYVVGEKDLQLMKKLSRAGNDLAKFLRMINVTLDITAPLYWWKEFDTYKVGTVANSCSTMHKIHAKEFTMDDFSIDKLSTVNYLFFERFILRTLNEERENYLASEDKEDWWQMIQLLPTSYNQKRTVQLNYQVLKNMYHSRRHHKLDEWHTLCDWMEKLPYFKEVCINAE